MAIISRAVGKLGLSSPDGLGKYSKFAPRPCSPAAMDRQQIPQSNTWDPVQHASTPRIGHTKALCGVSAHYHGMARRGCFCKCLVLALEHKNVMRVPPISIANAARAPPRGLESAWRFPLSLSQETYQGAASYLSNRYYSLWHCTWRSSLFLSDPETQNAEKKKHRSRRWSHRRPHISFPSSMPRPRFTCAPPADRLAHPSLHFRT